jgi:ribosomal protein S18 acetylase RimI-like enzyme
MTLRPARRDELSGIAELHGKAFPNFFLSSLGSRFLELMYRGIIADPGGVLYVAVEDHRLLGFVAGVEKQEGFYRRLIKQHKWAFAASAFGALARKPSIAPRLCRALRRAEEARQSAAEACLMSIAVCPDEAGRGIGRQLVQAFDRTMGERRIPAYGLTTDADNNERINKFYAGLGFRLARSFRTPEGRVMNEYVRVLERGA